MTIRLLGIALISASVVLAGCASSKSGNVYSRDQAKHEMTVRMAVIESIREVTMEGTKSPVGTMAGGVVGGVAGSNVGQGKGSTIGAVLGAVVGGIVGSGIEEAATQKKAVEFTLKLDDGRVIAIVQEDGGENFKQGERVRVLSGGGESRVSR